MCGIAGIVSPPVADGKLILKKMIKSLFHRGPDSSGVWWNREKNVGLAHQRLAIIDLSMNAHQPMLDDREQLCIVFNGEIYNYQILRKELEKHGHRFLSNSDTEVILHAYQTWGTDCVSRMNGMFAFCIYDQSLKRLFFARDRVGKKPLYYYHKGKTLLFASELKALMEYPEFPREIDFAAFNFYFTYGYVPGQNCILKNVFKLPPAHAMTYEIRNNNIRKWQYWALPDFFPDTDVPAEQMFEEFEDLLKDAVRLRLISDVPLGILLSGGLDSSLVTAAAVEVSPEKLKTFSISFPKSPKHDESRYARMVAEYFGTDHHELEVEEPETDLLQKLAYQYDEPIADPSVIPTFIVSRLIKNYANVAIGGDGGDELFGGYLHYRKALHRIPLFRMIPNPIRIISSDIARRILPIGLKGRSFSSCMRGDIKDMVVNSTLLLDSVGRKTIFNSTVLDFIGHFMEKPEHYKMDICPEDSNDIVDMMTRLDFSTLLPDYILVKVDRASMLTSLEVRAPLLDFRIVEFAFGRVPASLKANKREGKIFLRQFARRFLPKRLDLNRKMGFLPPLEDWYKGRWGNFTQEVLNSVDKQLFDKKEIEKLLLLNKKGRLVNNTQLIFAITMFELWRRHYRISI